MELSLKMFAFLTKICVDNQCKLCCKKSLFFGLN